MALMAMLDAEQLDQLADQIADRVLERLGAVLPDQASVTGALVTAQTVADALGCSREFVYRHADELGGHRVGDGPPGRLRFDAETALARWNRPAEPPAKAPVAHSRRRAPTSTTKLLPIRGER